MMLLEETWQAGKANPYHDYLPPSHARREFSLECLLRRSDSAKEMGILKM